MTIANQATKVVALGNGSQTVFDYDFLIPTASDVKVIYTDADGVETELTPTQYTITGINNEDGGTVTYPLAGSPIAVGTTLTIARNLQYVQLKTIANQGNFYPAVVESALDYITMLAQQLNELFTRAIVAPETDPDALLPLPPVAQRANQLLGFDADGNPIASEPSSALVSSVMQPVVAAATLALARTAMGLGELATLGVGGGLLSDDEYATVNFMPVDVATNQAPTGDDHLKQYNATGPITFTLAAADTYWSGYGFWINSLVDDITVAIDASDSFKGQASGVSLTIPPQWRAFIYTDGAATGVWYVEMQPVKLPIVAIGPGYLAPGGRLTLTTNVPVLTSDVSGATIVYYTPYLHNQIMLWDGETWYRAAFNELSQALNDSTKSPAAATANQVYDLFVWNDNGTIRCTRGPAWSSTTSRGTGAGTSELTRLNGCLVNAYAITNGPAANFGVYVGTIATDGSTQMNMEFAPSPAAGGTENRLDVWNYYNRVDIFAICRDSTNSWSPNGVDWRAANASTANRIIFVRGISEDIVVAEYNAQANMASGGGQIGRAGIGLDATNAMASGSVPGTTSFGSGDSTVHSFVGKYSGFTAIGIHSLYAIESCGGIVNFYGDNNDPDHIQMGLIVRFKA